MAVPTIYRSDDASAPTISGTAGELIALLDAILVNGYGAKSAAGWTKSYSGTNKAAYRQGNGNQRYLRVEDAGTGSATYARVSGYEAMTTVDAGTNEFPTDAQRSGGLYAHKSSGANATVRPWIAFATANAIFLSILPAATSLLTTPQRIGGLYFGDFTSTVTGDAYNTILIASSSSAYTSNWLSDCTTSTFAVDAGSYVCRDYLGSAPVEIDRRSPSAIYQISFGAIGVTYPDPATGNLNLTPVEIHEASYIKRGDLHGFWQVNHDDSNFNILDTFSGDAGGNLAGQDFIFTYASTGSVLTIETSGGWL